jgi:aminopeptidase
MPSGEVFTSPVEDSAEGEIAFTYPVCTQGKEIEDIRLRFEAGRVVEAFASKNEAFLRSMIATDDGSCYLGEVGIGTNFGIDRMSKNILFDEKMGGTVHLALGNSYPEAGGRNVSALHWDMICDLRRGGEMLLDGNCIQKDGVFQI